MAEEVPASLGGPCPEVTYSYTGGLALGQHQEQHSTARPKPPFPGRPQVLPMSNVPSLEICWGHPRGP